MNTYISVLRGINVGGHKKVKMDALRILFERLGFKNVQTYIQSGNVIFQTKKGNPGVLAKEIAEQITAVFSFEVPVIVADLNEMETVIANNPFTGIEAEDTKALHLTFLSEEPLPGTAELLQKSKYVPDEFILSGKVLYLYCPNGYGQTKLTNTFFENKLKVVATTRNWKTINELVRMAKAIH